MSLRPGVGFYVWQDGPASDAMDGYDWALVRAANGNSTKNSSGFDFAANFRAWRTRFGSHVLPWTYLYPSSSGRTAADALLAAAGEQPLYQCDLEDAVPPSTIAAFVDALHAWVPGCKVVFDSYPTRAQFMNVTGSGATWDQAVRSFDAFNPQVYYASQFDDGWENEFAGKPILPAFSPLNVADWSYFQRKLNQFGTVALWRYPGSLNWKGKLTGGDPDMTQDEHDALMAVKSAVSLLIYGDARGVEWDTHDFVSMEGHYKLLRQLQSSVDDLANKVAAGGPTAAEIADLVIAGVGPQVATQVADLIHQRMAS